MIVTEFYNGQGLGNQIWCYVVTRSISKKLTLDFGISGTHKFKGQDFLDLDFGKLSFGGDGPEGGPPTSLPEGIFNYYREKVSFHPVNGVNISKIDTGMIEIQDSTKIDGCMQSIEYLKDMESEVRGWIKTKIGMEIEDFVADDICIIHVRGGDFMGSTSILPGDYYRRAVEEMKLLNQDMRFLVVTDDIIYSKSILPEYEIIGGSSTNQNDSRKADHHIGGPIWMDWSIIKNAKNLIISSSSFSFWPSFLNERKGKIIAPMYWGDYKRSDGYWSCWDMIIDGWFYLDRENSILSSEECKKRRDEYESKNGEFLWKK